MIHNKHLQTVLTEQVVLIRVLIMNRSYLGTLSTARVKISRLPFSVIWNRVNDL